MGLSLATVLPDYKRSLHDAASVFDAPDDADFLRHLRSAARAISIEKRPRTCVGEIVIAANVASYAGVPENLISIKVPLWGTSNCQIWDTPAGPPPTLSVASVDGVRSILLSPAPTVAQIQFYGSAFRFYYLAAHELSEADGSLSESDGYLLILRAQVEAMRELTFRNAGKPVNVRAGGMGQGLTNMQPTAIWERLMDEYRAAA